MENEIWKKAKGFEDRVEVSNFGHVRQKTKSGEYKINVKKGVRYLFLTKTKNGITQNFHLHRVIYETFVGEIPEGYIIHHKDENKQNNAVSNLLMVSAEDHVRIHFRGKPSWKKGLKTPPESHKKQWITRHEKYSTEARDKNIFEDKRNGMTLKELSSKYNLCTRQILTICKQLKTKGNENANRTTDFPLETEIDSPK